MVLTLIAMAFAAGALLGATGMALRAIVVLGSRP